MNPESLGIDIGGVIIDRKKNDKSDTSLFGPNYLKAAAVQGAFATIKSLQPRFQGRIFLVSKCGHNIERKTREWLVHNRFPEETGVPIENVFFCRQRAEKAPICKRLGLTHFIDDRLEVLSYLESVPFKYLFDPNPTEVEAFSKFMKDATAVSGWSQVWAALAK